MPADEPVPAIGGQVSTNELPDQAPVRLIDPDGVRVHDPRYDFPSTKELRSLYRSMVIGKRFNEQASALVRQGRLAVYPSSRGQEACQVAAAAVLRRGDWLFPTYRDSVSVVERGVPPGEVLSLFRGDWHCGYDPLEVRVAPHAAPLATHLPHAVGVGHAARLKGEDTVVLALTGDGGTSEGDFHEALNFAGVFGAPVVFLIQNNKYAISVPLSSQTAAPSLAYKGIGYGVPSVRVDGNDIAALMAVLDEAVARAASGAGPTLVEADTYRLEPHTNADDATRYRDEDEVRQWLARDPIQRLRTYLVGEDALDEDAERECAEAADELATRMRQYTVDSLDPLEIFRHVYANPRPALAGQAESLRNELATEEDRP